MNQLRYPCFYPGDFAPPTKMHLNTLHWLLSKPEVGHVNVVLGKSKPGEITQEQKKALWEILLKSSMAPQASVIVSKGNGPISEIYDIFSKKKDMPSYIALDEKSSRNKKFQEKFEVFPHYGIQLIPSQFKMSSDKVIKAVQDNDDDLLKSELPSDFNSDMIKSYKEILKQKNDPEAPEEMSPNLNYKDRYISMFNDGFWKSVFNPINNDNQQN